MNKTWQLQDEKDGNQVSNGQTQSSIEEISKSWQKKNRNWWRKCGATSFPCKVLKLKRQELCISYAMKIISFLKHSKLIFCKKSPRIFCWKCTLDVPLVSKGTCVDMNFLYLALQHVWMKWSFLYEKRMELCSILHFISWFLEKNVLKTLMSFLRISHRNSLCCCSCRSGGHRNNTSWSKFIFLSQFQSFEFFQFFCYEFCILSFVVLLELNRSKKWPWPLLELLSSELGSSKRGQRKFLSSSKSQKCTLTSPIAS